MATTGYLVGGTIIVKCLTCKNKYDETEVSISMDAVIDDMDRFVQYDVTFTDSLGNEVFIQDLLCGTPKRCSIFGQSAGKMFAFPCLTKGKNSAVWHSSPDRNGDHFAIRAKA